MDSTTLLDRAVMRVSGADARGFLQGLLTQDVALVAPDTPRWGALLTPQGKALFDFILWDGGDDTLLIDCEADQRDALARRLLLYRLRRAITIEPTDLAVHWSLDEARGSPDPRLPELGRRWLASADGAASDMSSAWRRHRLGLGVVEGIAELGQDATLWLECNARELEGVSFTKGCYIGQENTARMHHRAKVNRRLVVAPDAASGDRTRVRYPELGWMVELRRVEALGHALVPAWLADALAEQKAEQ
jgi:folate-binding protein YgfZ